MMPPPNSSGMAHAVKRKEGIAAAIKVETVTEALARHKAGNPIPEHYIPTAALRPEEIVSEDVALFNPYKS